MDLAERILAGDVRAAARLMRMLDDGDARAAAVMSALHPRTGRARIVGVTGSPGTGKSTLIDALIAAFRSADRRVGVVAVDPTSPFTGGAILGDRVRMQRHATDAGVFIRSLATRGRLGGLSASTGEVVSVLDAAGYERIVVETVGVGQDEVEIVGQADVVVVVVSPGQGDEVQAHKAGVLEIADVLVVNKADVAGADRTARDLHLAVDLAAARAKHPKVLRTVASTGEGVPGLVAEVERLLAEMDREGRSAEVARARTEAVVADMAAAAFAARIREVMASDPAVRDAVDRVHRREAAPRDAADLLAGRVVAAGTHGGGQ